MQSKRVSIRSALQVAALSAAVCWTAPAFSADLVAETSPVPEVPADVIEAARNAITNGNVSTAYSLIRPYAEAGHAQAQEFVAYSFEVGIEGTLEQSECKAYLWYDKAAHGGHLISMIKMARAYNEGTFVEQDSSYSDLWLYAYNQHKSTQQNVPRSSDGTLEYKLQQFLYRVPAEVSIERSKATDSSYDVSTLSYAKPSESCVLPDDLALLDFPINVSG